jgi:hypothetical protein
MRAEGAVSAGLVLISAPALLRFATAQSWRDPFSLGIASGAPRRTALCYGPPGAGAFVDRSTRRHARRRHDRCYEIATDIAMRDIIRSGEARAE